MIQEEDMAVFNGQDSAHPTATYRPPHDPFLNQMDLEDLTIHILINVCPLKRDSSAG